MSIKEVIRTMLLVTGSLLYRNRKSKILYYHDFHDKIVYTEMGTSLSLFKKHLKTILAEDYQIVRNIDKDENQVAIMLDDGFRGVWDCREFFFENKIQPTIFIAKSLVGTEGYLTENEIRHLDKKGWNFQSHTVSHLNLKKFSPEQLKYELKESKRYLEEVLGHPVNALCAPQGHFSNRVCEEAYRAGYDLFYSSIPGDIIDRMTDFSFVRTRNLCQRLNPLQFKLVLLGGYKIFQGIYFKRRYVKQNN